MQLENWATGDAYEQFMGRWSAEVAVEFVKWLNIASHQTWLDLGCGTGALTRAIIEYTQPRSTFGLDASFDFARYARQQTDKSHFITADGSLLPFSDGIFDVLVSGLALNFIPKVEQAVSEMRRVVKPSGVVSAYVWDYAGMMEFLRYFWDTAVKRDETAVALHEGYRFPICQPDALQQLWQDAGLKHISVDAIDIATRFSDFESYWQPFTLGNFPAPKYVSALNEPQTDSLKRTLQATLPIEDDGSIHLIARVWAIRGSVPA